MSESRESRAPDDDELAGDQGAVAAADAAATHDDRALVDRLLGGDETAFTDLVSGYQPTLLRVARLFVHSPASAEEVVQETWLGVIRGLRKFEGRSRLRTWIFRILVNRAKTRAVREGRQLPFSALARDGDDDAPDADRFQDDGSWASPPRRWQTDTPEGMLLRSEVRTAVDRALEELPPMQSAVLSLRDIQGWTSREVCNELELSETNQRVLLHRARTKLRRRLEAELGKA